MDTEQGFGQRLKECRKDKSLTQKELGNLIGVSAQVISNWERGYTTGIGPDELKLLGTKLDCSVDYLVFGKMSLDYVYDKFEKNEKKFEEKHIIPILGTIRAGLPLLAEDNWQDTIEISNEIKADFALRVIGDSMSWVGIHEGDLALLQQTNVAQNGEIVAAGVEGPTWEATLKFYMSVNSHYALRAANPAYPDMLFTSKHRIIGTVVKVIKDTPSIITYKDFLTAKEIHDDDWAEAIEKAAQYGLGAKDVAQYIEMLSKMITKIEK